MHKPHNYLNSYVDNTWANIEILAPFMSYPHNDKTFHIGALVDAWSMPQNIGIVDNKASNTFPAREEEVGNENILCYK